MSSTLCTQTYLIKHLKQLGTWLMNGADDCPSSLSQRLHEGNDLEAGRAVQTTGMGFQRRQRTEETDTQFNLISLEIMLRSDSKQMGNGLPGGLIKEHDRRIVDQLEGDGQSFTLTTRETAGARLSTFQKTKRSQDLVHLKRKQGRM